MPASKDFEKIFNRLKKIIKKYEKDLSLAGENEENYSLEGTYSEKFKKNLWFGAVQIKKNYVSYHLMPVYMYKDLAEKIPDNLRKRMQGKSCFNFKTYDEDLFIEMEKFTEKCFKEFKKRGDNI
jgi:hypothetical protein